MKPIAVNTVRNDEDAGGRDSALNVALPDMAARNPALVDLGRKGSQPDLRDTTKLPCLHDNPTALHRRRQLQRPAVINMKISTARQRGVSPPRELPPTLILVPRPERLRPVWSECNLASGIDELQAQLTVDER